jgi:hypothetical protein
MLVAGFAKLSRGTTSTLPRTILTTRLEEHVAQSQKFSSLRGPLRILVLPSIAAAGSEL